MPKKEIGIMKDSTPYTIMGTHKSTHIILWMTVLFIVVFIIWANFAVLDEVTAAQGKVIPSSQIQIVQNLEGGIVKDILVHEGDIVERGQVLMNLEDTLFLSKYSELLKKKQDIEIELVRLKAEINQSPLKYSKELEQASPDLIDAENALYKARQIERKQMETDISLARKELNMTKPLIKKGAASPVEVLRLQRTVSEVQGKLHAFDSKTLERYNDAKGEYEAVTAEMRGANDRVRRTTIRSPVKGIIKQLKINTVGGVIKPGMDLIEIVPLDDTLLIEAKVLPKDIGFIHPGQKAMVKISAYDFSLYGGIEGKVEQISADTIVDENDKRNESFYLIRVRTQKNYLGTEQHSLQIIPGMQATVDILTGRKTVLEYLLKPLLKAKNTALRER